MYRITVMKVLRQFSNIGMGGSLRLASSIMAICSLAGCASLCSFVCQDGGKTSVAPAAAVDTLKKLVGRSYYRMGDDVACKANAPGRPLIKTWANKITADDKGLFVWGSICNDAPEFVPTGDLIAQIHIAPDLTSIIYKSELLTFYPEPPRLCDQGSWCPK